MLESIASLELEKYNLISQLQKRQNQYASSSDEVSQTINADNTQKKTEKKKSKNNEAKGDVNSSAISGDSDSIKFFDNDNSRV